MVEVKKRVKRELVMFDRLKKESQRDKTSVWKGGKGTYVFENTEEVGVKRPVRRGYLNRTYLTGLFRSRKPNEYLGDLKAVEGKIYLLFRVAGDEELEIFEKR